MTNKTKVEELNSEPRSGKCTIKIKLFLKGGLLASALVMLALQTKDVVTKYFEGKTTISMQKQEVTILKPPAITFYPADIFSLVKMKQFNDTNSFTYNFYPFELDLTNTSLSYNEVYHSVSFILGVDFNMSLWTREGNGIEDRIKLVVGRNLVQWKDQEINVTVYEMTTSADGICYTVELDADMSKDHEGLSLILQYDTQISGIPTSILGYLTDPKDRYGIIMDHWSNAKPFTFNLKMGSGDNVEFYVEKQLWKHSDDHHCTNFQEGETVTKCKLTDFALRLKAEMVKEKCPRLCYIPPAESMMTLTGDKEIGPCSSEAEFECFMDAVAEVTWEPKNKTQIMKHCKNPCERVKYVAQIQKRNRIVKTNSLAITLKYGSHRITVYEEYKLFDLPSFVGNVGGSLGLFIGFSYFDFVSNILDAIINILTQRQRGIK